MNTSNERIERVWAAAVAAAEALSEAGLRADILLGTTFGGEELQQMARLASAEVHCALYLNDGAPYVIESVSVGRAGVGIRAHGSRPAAPADIDRSHIHYSGHGRTGTADEARAAFEAVQK